MLSTIFRKAFSVITKKPLRLWGISLLAGVLSFAVSILFGLILGVSLAINLAISTSMTIIFLRGYRGEEVRAADLFTCLKDLPIAKRTIGGMAWMNLWLFIWALIPIAAALIAAACGGVAAAGFALSSFGVGNIINAIFAALFGLVFLLVVIAGIVFVIIKGYSYRLTPYILAMEPGILPTAAINVSKERTKGFIGKMFLADFLIVLAQFLVSTIIGFIFGILALIPGIGILFTIIQYIVIAVISAVTPLFSGLVQAAFYEEIMAKAKVDNN